MKYFEKQANVLEKLSGMFSKVLKKSSKPIMPTTTGSKIVGSGPAIGTTKVHGTTKARGSGYSKRKPKTETAAKPKTETAATSAVKPLGSGMTNASPNKTKITSMIGTGVLGVGIGAAGLSLLKEKE